MAHLIIGNSTTGIPWVVANKVVVLWCQRVDERPHVALPSVVEGDAGYASE
jgi:hypothetical protein